MSLEDITALVTNSVIMPINQYFMDRTPVFVILCTVLTIFSMYFIKHASKTIMKHGIKNSIELFVVNLLRKIPGGSKILDNEIKKTKQELWDSLKKQLKPSLFEYFEIPKQGVSRQNIRKELLHQLSLETSINENKCHAGLYSDKYDPFSRFLNKDSKKYIGNIVSNKLTMKEEAYLYFQHSNILYPFGYPGTRKFETEIISMVSKLLNSDVTCGTTTTGGTESIYMAMYCYRNYARKKYSITNPEIIVGISVHPAFFKAAYALNIKVNVCKVNNKTYKVNINEMKAYINCNTIALIGSAPGFPHGVIDDIPGICNIAKYNGRDIPVHVDNCLGGFLISFLDEYINKPWDFRVKGVTSISVDIHKHGGSVKGLSCIIYNNKDIFLSQMYSYVNWPGGMYVSSTFRGSGNGGIIASGWAMLIYNGYNTFKNNALKLYNAQQKLIKQITELCDGNLEILGGNNKTAAIIAFKFKDSFQKEKGVKTTSIAQCMKVKYGWDLVILQYPAAVHIQLGQRQIQNIQNNTFINNLKDCVDLILKNPNKYYAGNAQLYGTAAEIPDRSLVAAGIKSYAEFVTTPWKNTDL